MEANAGAVASTQYTLRTLQGIPEFNDPEEEAQLESAVRAIMEAVFNDPADTLWRKTLNSIKSGIIDVPFSPHIINRNDILTLRDCGGAIRIVEPGNVPLPESFLKFELSKAGSFEDKAAMVEKIIHDIGVMQ
jgi:methylaspartate mutase epsilon subunit